jgi:hypothetical protein
MKAGSVTAKFRPNAVQASHFRWPFLTAHLTPSAPSAVPGIEITVACSSERWETSALQTTSAMTSAPSEKGLMPNPGLMSTDDTARPFVAGVSFQPCEHGRATWPMSPSQLFRQTLLASGHPLGGTMPPSACARCCLPVGGQRAGVRLCSRPQGTPRAGASTVAWFAQRSVPPIRNPPPNGEFLMVRTSAMPAT